VGLRRLFCATLIAVALAGCDGVDLSTGLPFAGPAKGPGVRTLIILNGTLRVRGPEGYCIDQRASRAAAGFVVMGSCALVSETPIAPAHAGVLTFQAGEPGSAGVAGSEQALATMLKSLQGHTLLSAEGDAATVDDVQVIPQPGVVFVQFNDTGPDPVAGMQDQEWRAFIDLGGRLVTMALRVPAHDPMTSTQGQRLMQQAIDALRAANTPKS
jgi:hypothetical protein